MNKKTTTLSIVAIMASVVVAALVTTVGLSTLAHASACSLHFGSPGNPQSGCSVNNPKSTFIDAEHFHSPH